MRARTFRPWPVRGNGRGPWITNLEWSQLLAGPDAGVIDVSIKIPNGRYLLSAGIRGACTLASGDLDRRLEGRDFDPDEPAPWSLERVELGPVEVTDERLTARLAPDAGGSPFLIGYLGFRPLDTGDEASDQDQERLERLRSLGYVD